MPFGCCLSDRADFTGDLWGGDACSMGMKNYQECSGRLSDLWNVADTLGKLKGPVREVRREECADAFPA